MLSRQQKRKGKLDMHYLKKDGMVACNPRDKEASHRAEVQGIATENIDKVTCKKCWEAIRSYKVKNQRH